MKKILLSFIFALLTQILISYSPNIINAQGTISCLDGGKDTITGKVRCATASVNCEQGFQAPAEKCEDYAKENNSCPGIISCINPNIAPSPTPPQKTTPSPTKDACGSIQQKCCGTVSPVTCNAGFIPNRPNDPNSCICQPSPNLSCNISDIAYINVDSPSNNCVTSKCPASYNCDAKPVYGPLLETANCVCYGYNIPTPTIIPEMQACNTSIDINTLNACDTRLYKLTEKATRCGSNPKGFTCKTNEFLCMNGSPTEDNVVCGKTRAALPPCKTWTDLAGKPISPPDPDNKEQMKNARCVEIESAIGGLKTDVTEAIKNLFSIILSLSGGIATLLIIYSGYRLMTSGGNPEKVQGAKETLTSAIVGLLFIIFSLVILQIIGVDILKLPGFDK